jgi:hypothetical protein
MILQKFVASTFGIVILGLVFSGAAAMTEVIPERLSIQGVVNDTGSGLPIEGTLEVRFTLYDESGGTTEFQDQGGTHTDPTGLGASVLWTELQQVAFTNGRYAVRLGSNEGNPLPADTFGTALVTIGIQIDQDAELSPRLSLGAVPYSFKAKVAEDVVGDIAPRSISVTNEFGVVTPVIDGDGNWLGDASTFQGSDGEQGPAGETGPQGDSGPQGETGPQGEPGLAGSAAAQGIPGPAGSIGPQGAAGLIGPQGGIGLQGSAGAQGIQGIQGIQGDVGVQGPIGLTGATGAQGIQGDVGSQGPIGLTGPQGIQGDTGLTGAAGTQGVQGDTGPQGSTGPTGTAGALGLQGNIGVQGPMGLTGATGAQGIQGDVGSQGTQGVAGAVGALGATGPAGPSGGSHTGAIYRWTVFSSYDQVFGWIAGNNASVFGGINPSSWGDGSARVSSLGTIEEIRSFINRKGYGSKNATVVADTWLSFSSTNSKIALALFRVKNTTGAPIDWIVNTYQSSYAGWGEVASVALNGSQIYLGVNNSASTTLTHTLTIPANGTSTAIFQSASGQHSGNSRTLALIFYNDSLQLPAGLEYVDDLDVATALFE